MLRLLPLTRLVVIVLLFGGTGYAQTVASGLGDVSSTLLNLLTTGFAFSTNSYSVGYLPQTAVMSNTTLDSLRQNTIEFILTDGYPVFPPNTPTEDLLILPFVGSALVMTANLPDLNVSDVVLSSEVLAGIWMGTITTWDDGSITSLNPNITLPPHSITLVYSAPPNATTMTNLLLRALANASSPFAIKASDKDWDISQIVPAGSLAAPGETHSRIDTVLAKNYSITYLDLGTAIDSDMPYTRMKNMNGTIVHAVAPNIAFAMEQVGSIIKNDLTQVVYNTDGQYDWPLAYTPYITLMSNITSGDCGPNTALLEFLSWVNTNQEILLEVQPLGWAILSIPYTRALIDTFSKVTCNNVTSLTTEYIIGMGGFIEAIDDLALFYPSSAFEAVYLVYDTATTIQQMIEGTIDWGAVSFPPSAEQWAQLPNAIMVPMIIQATYPAYYIPELLDSSTPLALSMDVLIKIYAGNISKWNDPEITILNPNISLPDQDIKVILSINIFNAMSEVYTVAFSQYSPWWNETYGVSGTLLMPAKYPVTVEGSGVYQAPLAAQTEYSIWMALSGMANAFPVLEAVSLINPAGHPVPPTPETLAAAGLDYENTTDFYLMLGKSPNAFPIAAYNSLLINKNVTSDCPRTAVLLEWMYWTQSSSEAQTICYRNGVPAAGQAPAILRQIVNQLASVTCLGKPAWPSATCVMPDSGEVCSNQGTCPSGSCVCSEGYSGTYCQIANPSSSSSSSSEAIGVGLGVGISLLLLLLLAVLVIAAAVIVIMRRKQDEPWEISMNELEMEDQLGSGGMGSVYRAKWRGTEVAVKMITTASENGRVNKELARQFIEEVRVMTALRHPNVVLFMAACTRPPKMCIVMEIMTLGSLFELLHNELIPDIPMELKVKVAYQAAKGMHFLHSSNIVHRDLKSLNLLLDSKWNVKVSDFGLTAFREELCRTGGSSLDQGQLSVHWTAPEVLNESPNMDYMMADVYAFGIIMWEVLTRGALYQGMSIAAIAIAVIRDNLRPPIPARCDAPEEWVEIMTACWNADPSVRPSFLEVMTRLSNMLGEQSKSLGASSTLSSKSHGSSSTNSDHPRVGGGSGGGAESLRMVDGQIALVGPEPPVGGEVTFVFSDITRAASLWEHCPEAMRDATILHNDILRRLLVKHDGYEALLAIGVRQTTIDDDKQEGMHQERKHYHQNGGEGSFCLVFRNANNAIKWCLEMQQELLKADWPANLLTHAGAAEEWGDTDDRLLFRGLRVRMGVNTGQEKHRRDPTTRRMEYGGPTVEIAARMTAMTHGGQITLSDSTLAKLRTEESEFVAMMEVKKKLFLVGNFDLHPDYPNGKKVYELKAPGLEARFFGGLEGRQNDSSYRSNNSHSTNEGSVTKVMGADGERRMEWKEDNFLASANMVRWIIDFEEIVLGKQVGVGSYGVVHKGQWKGVEVAVKRFIKQKMDERRMLEFRAEVAFLSELQHPNIVVFIGACIKAPNLCLVTEFMQQGSLNNILYGDGSSASNAAVNKQLTWTRKLELLRSAAVGVNYLHTLKPKAIVHRDLKPTNLLVDENWTVKVADFGFARIKEDNATMTRCGTPAWTAPEVIRGEKYDEKADVHSFGVIMWQVLTRKQPFAGINFMGVSLAVLEGQRPQVPQDCPPKFKKLIKSCWHADPKARPSMEQVVAELTEILGGARVNIGGRHKDGEV